MFENGLPSIISSEKSNFQVYLYSVLGLQCHDSRSKIGSNFQVIPKEGKISEVRKVLQSRLLSKRQNSQTVKSTQQEESQVCN